MLPRLIPGKRNRSSLKTFQSTLVHGVNDVWETELHTAEPLVPVPNALEFELAIEKLKSHTSPGFDQISAELIKAGDRTIHFEIYKLTISIWNKEKLPEEWKESIIVPIYKKGNKTDCSNYRGILFLSTAYKLLSNILLSGLIPYAEKIIGNHQCGFRCNRSTTDHIRGGADKSLARPGRKQATMTKLGIYLTYSPRSSINFLTP